MSPACAAADRVRTSFAGCVFYTAEADNVATDATAWTSFLIANPGVVPANATLQQLVPGYGWVNMKAAAVPGGGAARLSVAGTAVVLSGPRVADGLRVLSDAPVTVAQIESDDSEHNALSTGGTMLLPAHVLGTHYRVMTYPQHATGAAVSPTSAPDGAGRLLVVGTRPDTSVTLNLPDSARMAVTGLSPMEPSGHAFQFVLGDGDVFQAWSGDDGEDLSGSEITASQPVAVFSGNITTTYGRMAAGVHSPDMAHEQIPPIGLWSYNYVAAALPPQPGTCDTLLGVTGASLWRLLAAADDTTVELAGPPGGAPLPPVPPMNAGDTFEMVATGDFVVTATQPLLMTQGIDCEPSLSLAVSADQMLEDVTFAVLPWFDQTAAIVRPAGPGDTILLDGAPVADGLFTDAGGGFEVARVPLAECPDSQRVCAHRVQGRFGMTVRGMDVLASYALTAPAWLGCHDPLIDLTCVQ